MKFDDHAGAVTCMQYNPRELKVATGGFDRKVMYWDLEEFKLEA